MSEVLQILDGGGLLAFAIVVYFQLREVRNVVSKTLERMLEVQEQNAKNVAVIMERQNTIMQRQDEVREGLNKAIKVPALTAAH